MIRGNLMLLGCETGYDAFRPVHIFLFVVHCFLNVARHVEFENLMSVQV